MMKLPLRMSLGLEALWALTLMDFYRHTLYHLIVEMFGYSTPQLSLVFQNAELMFYKFLVIKPRSEDISKVWIKAPPDFDVLFRLLSNLRLDEQRRFWIAYSDADEDVCDIREDLGQIATEVKIAFPMSHNVLTRAEEYI